MKKTYIEYRYKKAMLINVVDNQNRKWIRRKPSLKKDRDPIGYFFLLKNKYLKLAKIIIQLHTLQNGLRIQKSWHKNTLLVFYNNKFFLNLKNFLLYFGLLKGYFHVNTKKPRNKTGFPKKLKKLYFRLESTAMQKNRNKRIKENLVTNSLFKQELLNKLNFLEDQLKLDWVMYEKTFIEWLNNFRIVILSKTEKNFIIKPRLFIEFLGYNNNSIIDFMYFTKSAIPVPAEIKERICIQRNKQSIINGLKTEFNLYKNITLLNDIEISQGIIWHFKQDLEENLILEQADSYAECVVSKKQPKTGLEKKIQRTIRAFFQKRYMFRYKKIWLKNYNTSKNKNDFLFHRKIIFKKMEKMIYLFKILRKKNICSRIRKHFRLLHKLILKKNLKTRQENRVLLKLVHDYRFTPKSISLAIKILNKLHYKKLAEYQKKRRIVKKFFPNKENRNNFNRISDRLKKGTGLILNLGVLKFVKTIKKRGENLS